MSKQEYLKALNAEIQKLNGVIDTKIIKDLDYKRESRRHKILLARLRKEEKERAVRSPFKFSFFSKA